MIQKLLLFTLMLQTIALAEAFQWPNGAQCAVSLTFDDNLASQLDIAVPMLDKAGFKATFYSFGKGETLSNRMDEWRIIASNGHELGNHTLFHPCLEKKRGENRTWLPDHYKLENYNLDRIRDELEVANVLLQAIDGKTERTFAYPCCDTFVANKQSYIKLVEKIFPAARGIGSVPASMQKVNILNVESIAAQNMTGKQLIKQVETAKRRGTMAIFLFHGVDEGHLPITTGALYELVDYLAENRSSIWTDTFLNIMKHVKSEQERQSLEN